MSGTRTFTCLRCGKKCSVPREEYEALRDQPLCEDCRNPRPEQDPAQDTTHTPSILESGIVLMEKIVNINRSIKGKKENSKDTNPLD